MLVSLTIDNFAIIEHINIDFSHGMTVLSGETGAGKSIIIDALSVLCGGRGSSELIRQDCQKLVIEGQFTLTNCAPELLSRLTDFGIELDSLAEDLIIRREINNQGKNLIRVNGQLANVGLLKEIGPYLIDIHGQNEHQALLEKRNHLSMLDLFAGDVIKQTLDAYQEAYEKYKQCKRQWLLEVNNDSQQSQRLSFLEFQIKEIEEAQLVIGQDSELEELSKKMQHSQQISQNIQEINSLFSEDDQSVLNQVSRIQILLNQIESYHDDFKEISKKLSDLSFELSELAHQIAVSMDDMDLDNQSIDEVEERLAEIGQIKRKYKMSVEEILDYYQRISEEVYQIKHRDQYLEKIETETKNAYKLAFDLANKLSQLRQQAARNLKGAIESELKALYMENARFSVEFEALDEENDLSLHFKQPIVKLNHKGLDQIEFFVATNPGEAMKPLVKVASGGELSRFMLALKSIFSQSGYEKIMVFDEIDTGVSGKVAQAIALKIRAISQNHQVLCITHLPQVAAIANQQLFISKSVDNNRTSTNVTNLNREDRIDSIAQMMSGKDITSASLKLAQELMKELQD